MVYPFVPSSDEIAAHFIGALKGSRRLETPYRRWALAEVFPEALCTAILVLPIAPPVLGETDGTRDTYNKSRAFFTPKLRADFPVVEALSEALQRPDVARQLGETVEFEPDGKFLRVEYIQDLDGAWLEPHRDVPEKIFSMVVYLCTGPEAKDWGTDIYDDDKKWVGTLERRVQQRGDLQGRQEHLARLRQAPDHRRAPVDGGQLRARLAGPGAAGLPG